MSAGSPSVLPSYKADSLDAFLDVFTDLRTAMYYEARRSPVVHQGVDCCARYYMSAQEHENRRARLVAPGWQDGDRWASKPEWVACEYTHRLPATLMPGGEFSIDFSNSLLTSILRHPRGTHIVFVRGTSGFWEAVTYRQVEDHIGCVARFITRDS